MGDERKSTKIVATIGPACAAGSVLRKMVRAGMDVARINFSHSDADANLELFGKVREAAKAEGRPVAILQDLQGPKLRIGELSQGKIELVEEAAVTLRAGLKAAAGDVIPVPYDGFSREVKRGDHIILNGGAVELEVMGVEERRVMAKVLSGGTLLSWQGLTVPSAKMAIESLTEKDEEDLQLGLKQGVDMVALSFVREAKDVTDLRELIRKKAMKDKEVPIVIAKIEKREALENFDAILAVADGIMIARGDLGLETPAARVPVTQKELIAKCVVAGKPVIVATHMLLTMTSHLRPTRAEVSDVANAVIDHTDAVMLSEETALGRYPVKVIEMMRDTIQNTEESSLDNLQPHKEAQGEPVPQAVAAAAVEVARHIDAMAMLVTTRSGYSARAVARFRPEVPIVAATDSPIKQRQLMLSWGIEPLLVDGYEQPEEMAERAMLKMKIKKGEKVVVVSGLKHGKNGFDSGIRVVSRL